MLGIFGTITNPTKYDTYNSPQDFFDFLSNIFKFAGTIAGLFFVFKLILAGYAYLSAAGDEKKIAQAWATIWQSLIGLAIVASAFIISTALSKITGINPSSPQIYGPNQ